VGIALFYGTTGFLFLSSSGTSWLQGVVMRPGHLRKL